MTTEYYTSHHQEDSEDSYFVSMTDIMVGMLFVFIILLMYFVLRIQNTSELRVPASEYQAVVKELEQLKTELEQLKANPLEKYLKAADAARESILRNLKEEIVKASAMRPEDVKIVPEQGILATFWRCTFSKRRASRGARQSWREGNSSPGCGSFESSTVLQFGTGELSYETL